MKHYQGFIIPSTEPSQTITWAGIITGILAYNANDVEVILEIHSNGFEFSPIKIALPSKYPIQMPLMVRTSSVIILQFRTVPEKIDQKISITLEVQNK